MMVSWQIRPARLHHVLPGHLHPGPIPAREHLHRPTRSLKFMLQDRKDGRARDRPSDLNVRGARHYGFMGRDSRLYRPDLRPAIRQGSAIGQGSGYIR